MGPQKQGHDKFKKVELISSIIFRSQWYKLKINYKKKTGKFTNIKQNATKQPIVKEEIKRESKKETPEKMKIQHIKTIGRQ